MSIIDSITGIFTSKKEPKKTPAKRGAPAKVAPKNAAAEKAAPATVAKRTGSAPAMAAHSKDAASRGKSGQSKAASAKKSAH